MEVTAQPLVAGVETTKRINKASVLAELEKILHSPSFRSSARGQQFLSYVIHHKLEGHHELLKERAIGTELFHRPVDYPTGDDPVVRVQAGEVRRRLERYYHTLSNTPPEVRIELPVGSYAPEFHWDLALPSVAHESLRTPEDRRVLLRILVACGFLALLTAVIATHTFRFKSAPDSTLNAFWSPVFTTSQPVLICLAKPAVYLPSIDVYKRYSKTHPGTFQTQVERLNTSLPFKPKEKLVWGDMIPQEEFGVAMGDVHVAAGLSALFVRLNKPSQVRIGRNYSFEDLRNSPAVVVGAFNNRWTLEMTSSLHFVFADDGDRNRIVERTTGRVWTDRRSPQGALLADFAIVTRVLDSKTGQFLIAVAGIGGRGTRAAGEFISREDFLKEALRDAPSDWQKKNLQMVLETPVTDEVAGPPHVIAAYFW